MNTLLFIAFALLSPEDSDFQQSVVLPPAPKRVMIKWTASTATDVFYRVYRATNAAPPLYIPKFNDGLLNLGGIAKVNVTGPILFYVMQGPKTDEQISKWPIFTETTQTFCYDTPNLPFAFYAVKAVYTDVRDFESLAATK